MVFVTTPLSFLRSCQCCRFVVKMTFFMHACAFFIKIISLPLHVAETVGLLSFYKRVFPYFASEFAAAYNDQMNDKKRELFRSLSKFYPTNGPLRILEVGCGSGANFEYYPTGCKLTCTDPNPYFRSYLEKSMAKNDHLVYDSFVVALGENLQGVDDNSVDVVVCTLVLCTVKDVHKVLEESKRVLRPGGAFFFMEHVVSDPSSWIYFFQHVLQPLWYYLNDGCETTRAIWKDLEAAGFSDLQLRHIHPPLFFMFRPHIVGYAVK